MDELRGKVAVVTGAGSGIGRALAERFAAEGMRIVLADVDEAKLTSVATALAERGATSTIIRCDTSVAADVDDLARCAVGEHGAVHVVCNNAGVLGRSNAWTGPLSEWDWVLGVNLYGVIHGVRAFLPLMTAQGEGHIVNTASMAGLVAMPGAVPYNVSKHGVVALSEALFLELQATGSPVAVSVLCPGFVRTDLASSPWTERLGTQPDPATDPVGSMMFDLLRRGMEDGMAAEKVAGHVVDAIRARRFWILTHPASRKDPIERMRRASSQENPVFGPTSAHPSLVRLAGRVRAQLTRR